MKKCIYCVPYGILLGHVVCKKGLIVDPEKIDVIINLDPPKNMKKLHATLGHTGYYQKLIKVCMQITTPMEKLLKKDATFCWDNECQKSLDILKEKMVIVLILVFLD